MTGRHLTHLAGADQACAIATGVAPFTIGTSQADGATAIDARLETVAYRVAARCRLTFLVHTNQAHAIDAGVASLAIGTSQTIAAAIDTRLETVAYRVAARRRLTNPGYAHPALAVGGGKALESGCTRRADSATAIQVRFTAVLLLVKTTWTARGRKRAGQVRGKQREIEQIHITILVEIADRSAGGIDRGALRSVAADVVPVQDAVTIKIGSVQADRRTTNCEKEHDRPSFPTVHTSNSFHGTRAIRMNRAAAHHVGTGFAVRGDSPADLHDSESPVPHKATCQPVIVIDIR